MVLRDVVDEIVRSKCRGARFRETNEEGEGFVNHAANRLKVLATDDFW
jgi:hypothetical protein